jgi:dihydrofolate reductase
LASCVFDKTKADNKRTMQRKVIVYIATSLDGFIAKTNDDIGFLSIVEKEGEDYGYSEFVKSVDTVIIGRRTYDKVVSMGFEFPHSDKNTYVVTRNPRPSIGSVQFYSGSLEALVKRLKSEKGKNIYCDGGAQIVHELLKAEVIDELIISIVPIALGDGIRLFREGRGEQKLELLKVQSFDTGLVQLHYKCIF